MQKIQLKASILPKLICAYADIHLMKSLSKSPSPQNFITDTNL